MPVSEENVVWGYRMIVGREPEIQDIADHAARHDTLEALRESLMQLPEAQRLLRKAAKEAYQIPLFLLRRPDLPNVPWRFEEPSLSNPVSQICTSEQMESVEFRRLCAALKLPGRSRHRKVWEFTYILAALRTKGALAPGSKGLGFGAGREPLPSVFAKAGVTVMATDAPSELERSDRWALTGQWSQSLEDLWKPDIVDKADFLARVSHRPVDMNAIPNDLTDYDFCWSACALEHLGSLDKGLAFIRNSLKTVRPGGLAVHTTEFNLGSNDNTLESPGLSILRKRDIEQIIHELTAEGHHVEPLNLWPGAGHIDEFIDLPPFIKGASRIHMKLVMRDIITTSFGITIRKG